MFVALLRFYSWVLGELRHDKLLRALGFLVAIAFLVNLAVTVTRSREDDSTEGRQVRAPTLMPDVPASASPTSIPTATPRPTPEPTADAQRFWEEEMCPVVALRDPMEKAIISGLDAIDRNDESAFDRAKSHLDSYGTRLDEAMLSEPTWEPGKELSQSLRYAHGGMFLFLVAMNGEFGDPPVRIGFDDFKRLANNYIEPLQQFDSTLDDLRLHQGLRC